jgi:predicted enzyme related to lactoylglutathione lyase
MSNVMPHSPIAAVMVHVANVEHGLAWYQNAFPSAVRSVAPSADFEFLQVGNVQLELVPSDHKVSSGAAGSVVYWHVANLAAALEHFSNLGATLYRGPMQIEAGLSMCQVKDPWGNCIGLRGPHRFEGGAS